ncbi:hypothetical protein AB0A94_21620 [Streptomyces sp. NPDC044984]|uniref:hypothetical protein n=1 Tax=Streptomyces sp. NPDC044984 TaxID=3154335 RepID=UPI0033CA4F83
MALTALSGWAFSQHPSAGAEGRAVTGAPAAVPVDGGGATTGAGRALDTSAPAG